MKPVLAANFTLSDLNSLQTHEVKCYPISVEEARVRLQYGFLSAIPTQEQADQLSEVLGFAVPVSDAYLDIKGSGSVVVFNKRQWWVLVFETTYLHVLRAPEVLPPTIGEFCSNCGWPEKQCRCGLSIVCRKEACSSSRLEVTDEFCLAALEQWISTLRQTAQMDPQMIKLARIGARQVYYNSETTELALVQSAIELDKTVLPKAWSRWQALEAASFQKDPKCVNDTLVDRTYRFLNELKEHIEQIDRRKQNSISLSGEKEELS